MTVRSKRHGALVSAVIVSYRSEAELIGAVEALPSWCEVVVVDQHAQGCAGALAAELRPDVVAIRSGANRGFGAGCNLGAANATGDFLLFLNPDARIDGKNLERLVARCAEVGGAIVGPRIVNDDGVDETRARNWSASYRDVASLLVPQRLLPPSLQQDIPSADRRYQDGGEVPYVQGSCFVIGAQLFREVSGFDERFFLYGEEEYLADQLAKIGRSAYLCPAAVASHLGHTSTDKVGPFSTEQLFRSRVMQYRLRGHFALLGAVLNFVAVLGLLLSGPVRRVVGYRKSEDRAWCLAAMRGILRGYLQATVRPPA